RLRKAAEGAIPAKRTLVRGYSSKGGGQENLFFTSSEGLEARGAPFQQLFVSPSESNSVYERPPRAASFPQSVR
ncbi:hypothetical protein GBAR_LOCUS23112, partial [Geodia barretti]